MNESLNRILGALPDAEPAANAEHALWLVQAATPWPIPDRARELIKAAFHTAFLARTDDQLSDVCAGLNEIDIAIRVLGGNGFDRGHQMFHELNEAEHLRHDAQVEATLAVLRQIYGLTVSRDARDDISAAPLSRLIELRATGGVAPLGYNEWARIGRELGWAGPAVCVAHDGIPTTEAEDEADEDTGEPDCFHVIRLYPDEETKAAVEKNHAPSLWR